MATNLNETAFVGPDPDVDIEELRSIVDHYLAQALDDENKPSERAKVWRRAVSLDRYKKVPYEGAPNVTTPLTRQKVDGIKAHLFASIDQPQIFIVSPRTEKAQEAAPLLNDLMDTTIELTGSRREILKAIRDAVEVGTGHLKHVLLEDKNGKLVPASRYVPFEHVFVYPSANTRLENINYFERYYEPYHEIKRKAEDGIYWMEQANELLDGVDEMRMNDLTEVWECWLRYQGKIYEVRYAKEHGVILSYRVSDWGEMLGRAPYDPLYIEQNPTSYWGDSISQILEGLQEVADKAFNLELARGQFAMAPPIIVNPMSPIYRQVIKQGGLLPGTIYQGSTDPKGDVYMPLTQMNPFDVQLLQLAGKMAEEATITDLLIPGQALGGRKTATEVNALTSVGALKLRNYLASVSDGLRRHARTKWALIATYILKNPDLAFSTEFDWDVNGHETVPEKQTRLQHAQYLLNPAFIQMLQLAAQNPFVERILEAVLGYLDLPGLGATYRKVMDGLRQAQLRGAQGNPGVLGQPAGGPQGGGPPIGLLQGLGQG